jgi:hypothetical protein
MDKESEAPCVTCVGYSNFVKGTVYMTQQPNSHSTQPLKEAIDEWFSAADGFYGGSEEYVQRSYDTVDKPKHYMLFEKENIEVRDVIWKLAEKIQTAINTDDYPQGYASPLFVPDYVQMMQYLMRFMDKNGVEDLKKARWYLDKLIEDYEHHF